MVPTRRETIQCMSPIVVPFRWFAAEKGSPFHLVRIRFLAFYPFGGKKQGERRDVKVSHNLSGFLAQGLSGSIGVKGGPPMERTTVLPEIRKMRFEEEWELTPYAFLTGQSPIGGRPLVVIFPCHPNLPQSSKIPGSSQIKPPPPSPPPEREVFPENSGDPVSKRGSWTSFLLM